MRYSSASLLLVPLTALLVAPSFAAPPGVPYWVAPAGVFRPPPAARPPVAPLSSTEHPATTEHLAVPAAPVRPVAPAARLPVALSPVVAEVLQHLRRDHPDGARLDPLRDYHSVEEVLAALGDPWTRFVQRVAPHGLAAPYDTVTDRLDLDSGEILDEDEEAATYGPLGISLGFREGTDPVVMGMVATGPAWLAGLRPGDRIVAVHGVPTSLQSPSRLYYQIVHRPAALVTMEIERDGRRQTYELEAQLPLIPPVRVRALADGFAYARVPLFTTETAMELDHQLTALEKHGRLRGMVLDLRGNPGGRLHLAIETSEMFLGLGLLSRVQERTQATPQYCVTRDTNRTAMPLVVLVDRGTGGVAEIVAGGLQENGRALIVGERTAGKGTVYQTAELSDGSELHLTTGHAFLPSGQPIEGHGILPDIHVQLDPMTDPQLYSFRLGSEMSVPTDLAVPTCPMPADAQLRRAIDMLHSGAADLPTVAARRKVPLPTDQELLEP